MRPPIDVLQEVCDALNCLSRNDLDLPMVVHDIEPAYVFGDREYTGDTSQIVGYDDEFEIYFGDPAHPAPFGVRVRSDRYTVRKN